MLHIGIPLQLHHILIRVVRARIGHVGTDAAAPTTSVISAGDKVCVVDVVAGWLAVEEEEACVLVAVTEAIVVEVCGLVDLEIGEGGCREGDREQGCGVHDGWWSRSVRSGLLDTEGVEVLLMMDDLRRERACLLSLTGEVELFI